MHYMPAAADLGKVSGEHLLGLTAASKYRVTSAQTYSTTLRSLCCTPFHLTLRGKIQTLAQGRLDHNPRRFSPASKTGWQVALSDALFAFKQNNSCRSSG